MEDDREARLNELRRVHERVDVRLRATDLQFIVVELLVREAQNCRM